MCLPLVILPPLWPLSSQAHLIALWLPGRGGVCGLGLHLSSGSGRAFGAMVPASPTSVTAVPGDRSARVNWTAPVSDESGALTGYTVTVSPGGVHQPPARRPPMSRCDWVHQRVDLHVHRGGGQHFWTVKSFAAVGRIDTSDCAGCDGRPQANCRPP